MRFDSPFPAVTPYLDRPIEPTPNETGGVTYRDVFYPYNFETMIGELRQMHLPLREQIDYLQQCAIAYSIERRDLMPNVLRTIHQLQKDYERMAEVFARTRALDAQMDIHPLSDVESPQKVENQSLVAKRSPLTAEAFMDEGVQVETFVLSNDIETEDVRSLQKRLADARLIAPLDGCPYADPLLIVFGAHGFRRRRPCPVVWWGKNNQLHLLIDTLYQHGILRCEMDRKWEVAAQLFVNGKQASLYTSKQLANTSDIALDDEQTVMRCIPALWLR